MRMVLRVINRDSILAVPERGRVGLGVEIIGGFDTPNTPSFATLSKWIPGGNT